MRQSIINKLRWKLFKVLSNVGWWVCPEPHRTVLQMSAPTWVDIERSFQRSPHVET